VIKFKITPERFAEACNVIEYINATAKIKETIIRIAPRFILGEDSEYIVKVNVDEDGDIRGFEGAQEAFLKMAAITPKRLEKLVNEFSEAAKGIVNPTNGRD
jgi:hypothetical protein